MKNAVLFCLGVSGAGKSYFINNTLPAGLFYNLKSATTRDMRPGEVDGVQYYFRNEKYFDNTPLVTKLWVNHDFWQPGMRKWLYGVPEQEVLNNLGNNLTYDVIQPRYAREMIDWFKNKKLDRDYVFKIAWFLPGIHNFNVVARRANMPNDLDVRRANTCDVADFINVGLRPDYILRPITGDYDTRLNQFIWLLADKTTEYGR